jgi:hypothetical protein
MKIFEYKLSEEANVPIGWIPSLSPSFCHIENLYSVSVLEYRVDDLRNLDSEYDQALARRKELIARLLSEGLSVQFFYWDLMPDQSTRVRSYKGVFPFKGSVRSGECIQWEFMTGETDSVLVGAASVNLENIDECCFLAADRRRGVFILNRKYISNQEELVASSMFLNSKPSYPNLSSLLSGLSVNWDGVVLFGGDQGVSYLNASIYGKDTFIQKIKDLNIMRD